ncbi:MAG TPA: hypothetical protein VKO18_12655 [Terriglobia bacterium]|nr:hypothetical protein [Terriglobia bacterium]
MGSPTISLLFLALAQGVFSPISASLGPYAPLDLGFRQMYDHDFGGAHRTFQTYVKAHPDDPFGPTADGAAYLFEEFDRLGVLQTELFVDDEKFKGRDKPSPNPTVRAEFNGAIAQSQKLADAILQRSPNDRNALFATVLNLGLESDYLALVEKHDLPSLAYTKRAGLAAEKLLAVDPTCYDAYLAIGVENYILGLKPAPVRWVLRLYGAETDKAMGIQKLQLTATKGHYLLPFARLLLAVAALRDKNRDQAKELLQNLAEEFPDNQLYRRELSRLP